MIHPGDAARLQRLFSAACSSVAATAPVQLRYRHGDGSWRLLDALGQRVQDEHGAMTVISARDVTDRVQLEEDFRRAQKTEALARITSAVARDFDNLLTVIRGNVALALEDTGHDDARGTARDPESGGGGVRDDRAAHDVRRPKAAFGRRRRQHHVADAGDDPGALPRPVRRAPRRCPWPATLACAWKGARSSKSSSTSSSTRGKPCARVAASSSRPGTCAWRARDGPHARAAVRFRRDRSGRHGRRHDARGAAADHRAFLHDEHGTRGPGHGLARVCAIVREAGGTITVDTEPGKGTTFSIRLPLVPALERTGARSRASASWTGESSAGDQGAPRRRPDHR